jgi:hypothetical protein
MKRRFELSRPEGFNARAERSSVAYLPTMLTEGESMTGYIKQFKSFSEMIEWLKYQGFNITRIAQIELTRKGCPILWFFAQEKYSDLPRFR